MKPRMNTDKHGLKLGFSDAEKAIRITIRDNFVFLRKFFAWRSGTGVSPVRFNQVGILRNSQARRPCHYFGCGCAALSLFAAIESTRQSLRFTVSGNGRNSHHGM